LLCATATARGGRWTTTAATSPLQEQDSAANNYDDHDEQ
jgi:hypothetical protein